MFVQLACMSGSVCAMCHCWLRECSGGRDLVQVTRSAQQVHGCDSPGNNAASHGKQYLCVLWEVIQNNPELWPFTLMMWKCVLKSKLDGLQTVGTAPSLLSEYMKEQRINVTVSVTHNHCIHTCKQPWIKYLLSLIFFPPLFGIIYYMRI